MANVNAVVKSPLCALPTLRALNRSTPVARERDPTAIFMSENGETKIQFRASFAMCN
jgi:hypothetical protein